MLAHITTAAVVGLQGCLVDVQVDLGQTGLPAFYLVGLPNTAVKEARERVRAAIKHSSLDYPLKRITANLAPAELPKQGPSYDLPLAMAILVASGQLDPPAASMFVGELSLDGVVQHTQGMLPMVAAAREAGIRHAYVPMEDAAEGALVDGIEVIGVPTLAALVGHLRKDITLESAVPTSMTEAGPVSDDDVVDFAHIRGQEHAKRAMELAAAGGHNVLLSGPPGSGKTLLARALPGILSPLTSAETLEVTRIYSVAGVLPPSTPVVKRRPFRSPHHTVSYAGLVGGGSSPRPGEISLAHRGVLFLDELPEFHPRVLEVLRQPVEDGLVTIARARETLTFPARFTLVAARNPCPCGYYGDATHPCSCAEATVTRYQKRLSGPILDRIDVHLEMHRADIEKLTAEEYLAEPSSSVRERVTRARQRQWARFAEHPSVTCNADMRIGDLRIFCELGRQSAELLRDAVQRMDLSARAYHRVLRLARTIADLAGSDQIEPMHVAEAVQYQPRGTDRWSTRD